MSSSPPAIGALAALVADHGYFHVRHYEHLGISGVDDTAARAQELAACSLQVVLRDRDDPVAAAGLRPHEFETEVLGHPVWRSTPLYTAGTSADRGTRAASLCRALLDGSGDEAPALVILRIDADDVAALVASQRAGFVVCDAGTIWLTTPQPEVSVRTPDGCEVRVLDAHEAATLRDTAIDAIVDAAGTRFRQSHFHTDPTIEPSRSDDLYRRWARNTFRSGWSDRIVTVTRDEVVVGFLGFAIRTLRTGSGAVDVATDSFGLALEDAPPGVGTAMFRTAAAGLDADVVEYGTQLRSDLVPMFARSGLFRSVASYYTLHGWRR